MDTQAHHRWWNETGSEHINRVLHDDWNPIGFEMPADEYSTYAGTVGRLLREESSADDIAAFLGSARRRMGLEHQDVDVQTDRRIATSLGAWY
jgi:hypothetical protein